MPRVFRALRRRNYRLFFAGQALSLTGMWIQMVAQSWLMYRLTDQAFAVAWVAIAQQGPGLLVGPLAGALADRHSRRSILVLAQAASVVPSLVLAGLVMTDRISVVSLFTLSLVAGVARAFEIPTRQAFVPELVDREEIPNAIGLNSIVFNIARLVGPALGGGLIATVGEAACFAANAVLLVPVVGLLLAIRISPRPTSGARGSSLVSEVGAAVRYVFTEPILWALLGGLAVASVAGMPYTVLLPSFASRVLGAGPETFGVLTGSVGIGAIMSAFVLAARKEAKGLDTWLVGSGLLFAVGLFALSRSTTLLPALFALSIVGAGFMFMMAATNTLVQLRVPDDLRGRVMSFHTALFLGLFPFGGLAAGALADSVGEAFAIQWGGVAVAVSTLGFGSVLLRHRREWQSPDPEGVKPGGPVSG